MMHGKIKFFHKSRGWGFIKTDEGKEYFVHYSQIQMDGFRTLHIGDIVSFEISESDENSRLHAVNVQPVLTLDMVVHELAKDNLYAMRFKDDKGVHGWYVVDKSNHPVVDKEMNLIEMAKYAGFEIQQVLA